MAIICILRDLPVLGVLIESGEPCLEAQICHRPIVLKLKVMCMYCTVNTVFYFITLYCTVNTVFYCITLYCIVLFCTMTYSTERCIVLYYSVIYSTV